MSAGWLLLGLLAIAFVGSSVARGRAVRGFGLPSGSEWLLSGIVFGPQLLGLVGPKDLAGFAPLVAAGSGWVALTIGQRFGVLSRPVTAGDAEASRGSLLLGIVVALLTTMAVASVAYALLGNATTLPFRLRMGTALYLGIMLSGSTRQLVDWARERRSAKGKVTDTFEAMVSGTELVALLGAAPLSVLLFAPEAGFQGGLLRAVFPIALGLLLGKLTVYLLRVEVRLAETWGILLGVLLLATGLSLRVGASVIATGFVLGWTLGKDRRSGHELRLLTHPTEGAVVLPLLVIAGAAIDWTSLGVLGLVLVVLVILRSATKLLIAAAIRPFLSEKKLPVWALGAALSASGEITCLLGLGFWLAEPNAVGQLVLAIAVSVSLMGEVFGAKGLRSVLIAVEEVASSGTSSRAPAQEAAPREGA